MPITDAGRTDASMPGAEAGETGQHRPPPSRLRRIGGRIATGLATLVVVGIAVALVVVGADRIATLAARADPPDTADPVPVATVPLVVQDGYTVSRRFLGQVEPAQIADLSFELTGRIVEIAVDEGDRVARGEVLARLDTALLETERARLDATREALSAQLTFAEQSLERRAALRERGFSPDEALDRARAERDALAAQLVETQAARDAVAVRLEKSSLTAPFDGIVGARRLDTGATAAPGQTVLGLFEAGALTVRVGLPLWVDPADHAEARIEIGSTSVPATLRAVRPDIDPVTRTRTAIYAVDARDDIAASYGETAALSLDRRIDAPGFWVPVAALREGLQGVWTVLVVDDGVVRPAAVEILHTDGERAYVAGAVPAGARLIAAGPHRVAPGQRVAPLGES